MPTENNPATLEEAREILLQNSETIDQLNQQINTLTEQNQSLSGTVDELRTLNQRLFLRASQGSEPEPKEDEPHQTLEEYALDKLKGVFI